MSNTTIEQEAINTAKMLLDLCDDEMLVSTITSRLIESIAMKHKIMFVTQMDGCRMCGTSYDALQRLKRPIQ